MFLASCPQSLFDNPCPATVVCMAQPREATFFLFPQSERYNNNFLSLPVSVSWVEFGGMVLWDEMGWDGMEWDWTGRDAMR